MSKQNEIHETFKDQLFESSKIVSWEKILDMNIEIVVDVSGYFAVPNDIAYTYVYAKLDDLEDNIDKNLLTSISRMISSLMHDKDKKILIYYGEESKIKGVVGACAICEFIGCSGKIAAGIVRANWPEALKGPGALEVIHTYRYE